MAALKARHFQSQNFHSQRKADVKFSVSFSYSSGKGVFTNCSCLCLPGAVAEPSRNLDDFEPEVTSDWKDRRNSQNFTPAGKSQSTAKGRHAAGKCPGENETEA